MSLTLTWFALYSALEIQGPNVSSRSEERIPLESKSD